MMQSQGLGGPNKTKKESLGVVKVGWYIIFHRSFFWWPLCAGKNSRLSQSKQPNFDYPQMHNILKNIIKLSFCMRTRTNPSMFERTHSMHKLSKKAIYIKEYEAVVASRVRKAFIRFCLDDEDSFEDEIDECMLRELYWRNCVTSFEDHTGNGRPLGNACSMMASI